MIKYYIRIKLCSTILLICIIISEDYLLKKNKKKKLIPSPKMWQHFEICLYILVAWQGHRGDQKHKKNEQNSSQSN